jgi:hypothetical protein
MPMSERAKIFIPFDPLKGFDEALRKKEMEAERIPRSTILDDHADELDRKMFLIEEGDEVSVTYYDGTEYVTLCGELRESEHGAASISVGGIDIAIADIRDLERL